MAYDRLGSFQYCQPAQNQPKSQILFHIKLLTAQYMYNDFGTSMDETKVNAKNENTKRF